MYERLKSKLPAEIKELIYTLMEISRLSYENALKRSPKSILRLYNMTFLHSVPVSYTHLRAHETEADLVCRLLLEKKNSLSSRKEKNKGGAKHSIAPIKITLALIYC